MSIKTHFPKVLPMNKTASQRTGWVIFGCIAVVGTAALLQRAVGQDEKLQDKFREVDRNADGVIDPKELPDQALFKRLDIDADGKVTSEEARKAFRSGVLTREMIEGRASDVQSGSATPSPPSPRPDSLAITGNPKKVATRLKPSDHGVGKYVADFEFRDLAGVSHRLSEFKDRKVVVVAMTSTSCPLSRKLLPALAELTSTFDPRQVQFVAVNCVPTDDATAMKTAAATFESSAIYVHDDDEAFARHMGALTTTDVFVMDAARTVVYHGAINDQYGIGFSRDSASNHFLNDAITAALAGKTPEVEATAAPGCALDLEPADAGVASITWHNRVSRIVQQHCVECHRDGGVGPFSLETSRDVVAHAGMIKQVVDDRTMPPWFAAPSETAQSHWANDRSLPDVDRKDLLSWLGSGRPEGDPTDAPLPRKFPNEWTLGVPDYVVQLSEPVKIKATGTMPYKFTTVETTLQDDKWVRGYEILPTDRSVVHHVIVNVHKPGGRIRDSEEGIGGYWAVYVPGNAGQIYPKGFARKLPAGATVSFQIHYTPNGVATTEQLRLGLFFADEDPEFIVNTIPLADRNLNIPPNHPHHIETRTQPVPEDISVMAYMAHMHLRGKSFRFDLTYPDGTQETLLDIPRYDFNWQLRYDYAEPKVIPRGSRVTVTAVFDNSDQNPANPDPTKTVRWGPQTDEEMMIGYVETFVPVGSEPDSGPAQGRSGGQMFANLDEDGDGKLTLEELSRVAGQFPRLNERPGTIKRLFDRLDSDKDGALLPEDFERLREMLGRR